MERIFIAIPSCKDAYLNQTIRSAISNASDPGRLYFGIVNNIISEEDYITDPLILEDKEHFSVLEIKSDRPLGIGASRLLAQMAGSFFVDNPIDFALQIDAHMIFETGWDDLLIDRQKRLEALFGSKVAISNSCDWWSPRDIDGRPVFRDIENLLIDAENYKPSQEADEYSPRNAATNVVAPTASLISEGHGRPIPEAKSDKYMDNEHIWWESQSSISGHMLFSRFNVITDFLHDPMITWDGDRFVYGFRLIASGYKLFAVNSPILLHLNSRYQKDENGKDVDNEILKVGLWRSAQDHISSIISYRDDYRIYKLISGEETGYWGAPDTSAASYARKIMGPVVDEFYSI